MKIIHITTFLDFGGIETKKAKLSQWNDNHEWVYVSIGRGGRAEKKIVENGKRVEVLNLHHRIPSVKTLFKLYQFLSEEKPDIIHTAGSEANFFGFIAGKLAKVPKIIIEEIGIPTHSKAAERIFKLIYKKSDLVIGESQLVVDNLLKKYNLPTNQVKVLHNFGVFNYDFSKIELKESELFRILMISRLEPVKNLEGAIDAVCRIHSERPNTVMLTIAGSGSLENALKKKVEEQNLQDVVRFVGFVNDPYPYLLNSDLYLLNSFSEGFSNSLIEAMYSGIPCLSTLVGSAEEVIENNINGFLIAPNHNDLLYNKLLEIMSLPLDQRREIGMSGRRMIENKFSIKNHVAELKSLYKIF